MRAIAPCLLAALALAACSDPGTNAPAADPTNAPSGSSAPATVSYRCDDGTMLQVDYGQADANVRWADGRSARLPRAESASSGGAAAYVGTEVSLQRSSSAIELHDGEQPPRACDEVRTQDGAGVATHYACEADTQVTMLEDGTARIALPDGQQVIASRIAGSTPPVFTGQSLYFTIGEDGARLSQDGQARELACKAG